jgi:hypothetical protein
MKLINLNSKKGIVNLLADFILERIDKKYESIIQVVDSNYFFLVYGVTESTEILDLNNLKGEFVNQYSELLKSNGYSNHINIMDLIKYNEKPIKSSNRSLWVKLYNSERPIYHSKVLNKKVQPSVFSVDYTTELEYEIELNSSYSTSVKNKSSELLINSEFPYGYSLQTGRSLLYYSEYIMNQLFSTLFVNSIDLYITNKKNVDGDQNIEVVLDDNPVIESTVKSIILDNFSFNFKQFESNLSKYNLCDDIKKPTESKPWLVKDVDSKDLLIL